MINIHGAAVVVVVEIHGLGKVVRIILRGWSRGAGDGVLRSEGLRVDGRRREGYLFREMLEFLVVGPSESDVGCREFSQGQRGSGSTHPLLA